MQYSILNYNNVENEKVKEIMSFYNMYSAEVCKEKNTYTITENKDFWITYDDTQDYMIRNITIRCFNCLDQITYKLNLFKNRDAIEKAISRIGDNCKN
jgi:hypothetical protein